MNPINKNELAFRRQFILGSSYWTLQEGWVRTQISEKLFLTSHPDLEVVQTGNKDINLTLIGCILDPHNPSYSNNDIIENLLDYATCFDDIIRLTEEFTGRWIIIYHDKKITTLINDACGQRQVYYFQSGNDIWCASQSELLSSYFNLEIESDQELVEFLNSNQFEAEERAWIGDQTVYTGINHLLPNHYLNLNHGDMVRYWPNKSIEKTDMIKAIDVSKGLLIGSLKAAANRYPLMIAVTAGVDSRVLLAASKDIKNQIQYYVSTMGRLNNNDPDIFIPQRLTSQLGLQLDIIRPESEFDNDFVDVYKRNVTLARMLPKTRTIYHFFKHSQTKVNVCGNVSEIARCYYSNKIDTINGESLAKLVGYSGLSYPTRQLEKWLAEARIVAKANNINILDLFYWEQRMGNWGAMYQAEQDIAIEEICPFNNRKLLTTLLSVDETYRSAPDYFLYKELIKSMWPETMNEPFNPDSLKQKIRKFLGKLLPMQLKAKIKQKLNSV